MINFLTIKNIVLIDRAEIKFSPGLCVLTGETGSGKSILLDALGLVIGFRSSLRLIGNDENKSEVSAEFDISNNQICKNLLQENDLLDIENPNILRIRRTIKENSNSKVYLNDILIGVNLLSKIGENLVEIHGQHDQGGLLNSSLHGQILDEFSSNQNLLKEIKKIYEELKEVEKKISDLQAKREQAMREKDYLQHIIKELESANLKDGEEDLLITKKDQLNGKEKILNFLSELKLSLIESNSKLISSQKILIRNQNLVNNYLIDQKEDFEKLSERIDQENIALDSSISTLESFSRDLKNHDENLDEIEERLFYIRSLARKFNCTTNELPNIIFDAKEKLKLLQNEEEFTHQLDENKKELLKNYKKIAEELSERRRKSALVLSKKVEEELQFLKMENTKFLVEVSDIKDDSNYGISGFNKIKFLSSINKNNFDDIAKIASGGELSRFMLALKVALINVKSVPTMIFDEIDTGIGGSTADAVGKRLRILSKNLQILVVTHQPQIAAKADIHFKIRKISNDKIRTEIEKLDEENRKIEIARMLSGEKISKEAILAAENLIREGLY